MCRLDSASACRLLSARAARQRSTVAARLATGNWRLA
ncbi:hypothetical protein GMOD_00010284 [Pyrenophora seminiperda CCB06]|uniref:Uncharacterized protein n=1 Tax=Pyrenophora seminiperda CCB06 TaxID=1302712 RepID=A0A3M7M5L6_9PLEO|nr:hypothetical protein GMOD_00010284 [Pyrenophora seminiperda CCB06]